MHRSLGTLIALALVGASSLRDAFAQGLPAPGPGGPPFPSSGDGPMVVSAIILGVALLGGLILAVAIVDLRRKRRAQSVAIEGQIADALMREPSLARTMVTTVVNVPLTGRAGPTAEVRGEVEYPELREAAIRVVRQELLRHHPEAQVEDRIFVAPPVPAGRH
jgi:hypothetical protein